MTKTAYLISALMLIGAGVACAQVPVQPDGEEIIITPVAFQTQTPPEIFVAAPTDSPEEPSATESPSPTPTPYSHSHSYANPLACGNGDSHATPVTHSYAHSHAETDLHAKTDT